MLKYPHMFAPLTIKGVTFKNRVMAAPMTTDRTVYPGGTPTPECINGYEVRARGGVSCVTLTESFVDEDRSARHDHTIDFYTPNKSVYHQEALFVLAESITRHGAVASVQFNHAGGVNHPDTIKGHRNPFGPSAFVRPDGVQVEEMAVADMEEVADHFAQAALGAKLAGFQMIMLHGGHGWLLGQFVSPLTNHRTDEFGGSLENRARFPLMVIDRIHEVCGNDLLIEYRMSGSERVPGGFELGEAAEFARIIQDKVDIIHVTSGMYHNHVASKAFSSSYHPHGCNLDLAEAIKKAVHIPVTAVGGFNSPEQIEEAIASGKCDFVAMGRQMLADPEFVNKTAKGREDEIMPCLRCSCFNPLASDPEKRMQVVPFECTVNPTSMRQLRLQSSTPDVKEKGQKVLVAGGGPGGMYAALTAAERGHRVTLMDDREALGGTLWYTDYDPHKEDMRIFRDHLANRVYRAGVDVQLGKRVTKEIIEEFAPDAVILAIGGHPAVPDIPGLREYARYALDAYTQESGRRVVMLGGGLVGMEIAIHLGNHGHDVTVLARSEVCRDAFPSHREAMRLFKPDTVTVCDHTRVTEVTSNGVRALDPEGKEVFFPADTVYYAMGTRAPTEELGELRSICARTAVIGDCNRPARIMQAVRDGMFAALDIV